MTRSWAYNRFGVLMGTSWRASGPRWPSLRGDIWPMITLFLSQGDFCATAIEAILGEDRLSEAGGFERFIRSRRGDAHHFDPEADRSDHILSDPQAHHGLLFVPKRGWILHNGPECLRQPR